MKKLIIAAIAVFTVGAASAQDLKIGVKGGANYSTLTGDIEETDGVLGFAVGGFLNVKINEKFAFQPELLYSIQGTSEKFNETFGGVNFSGDSRIELAYVNVPLMFQVNVTDSFIFEAGPQIGFLTSAKEKTNATTTNGLNSTTEETSEDVSEDFNNTDFGFNFGLGYNLSKNLNAGLRYNLGLTNVLKDSDDFTAKNSVISLTLGYSF